MKRLLRTLLALFAIQSLTLSPCPAANPSGEEWQRYVVAAPDVVYPEVVKRTGTQGIGTFLLSINPKDGSVTEVKVVKGTRFRLLNAIYVMNFFQWRFRPGTITSAKITRGVGILGRAKDYHY
jgi:outer membrane biosynthesis protein TonB